jgi:hypothetical protein
MNRGNIYSLVLAGALVLVAVGIASHIAIVVIGGLALSAYSIWAIVTYHLNRSRDEKRRRSLEARISGDDDLSSEAPESSELAEARSRLAAEDLRLKEYKTKRDEAEDELRPYLPANPRGAKRLINHERLYVQIAEDRNIFGGDPELTYRHLAKWVLIVEHWPRLGAALTREPDKIEILENCASVEALQEELKLIDPNIRATDQMLRVFSKAIPLSPILGRLVRFEPSVTSIQEAPYGTSEADETSIPDASLSSTSKDNQSGSVPAQLPQQHNAAKAC